MRAAFFVTPRRALLVALHACEVPVAQSAIPGGAMKGMGMD